MPRLKPFLRWLLRRNLTLSMLGVPVAQREQLEQSFSGGIAQFVEDSIAAVFAELPLKDNYFWRVYLTGEYTPECCPEYLKRDNFNRLKAGLIDNLSWHTDSVQGFLEQHDRPISRFVLLDHMDWLHGALYEGLVGEWQAIVDRAAPDAVRGPGDDRDLAAQPVTHAPRRRRPTPPSRAGNR